MTTAAHLRLGPAKVKPFACRCAFESRSRCPYFDQPRRKRTGPPACQRRSRPEGRRRRKGGLWPPWARSIWGQCRVNRKRENLEALSKNSQREELRTLTLTLSRFAVEGTRPERLHQ